MVVSWTLGMQRAPKQLFSQTTRIAVFTDELPAVRMTLKPNQLPLKRGANEFRRLDDIEQDV